MTTFYIVSAFYLMIGIIISNIHSLGISEVDRNRILKKAFYNLYIVFLWPVYLLIRGVMTLFPNNDNNGHENEESVKSEENKEVDNDEKNKEEERNEQPSIPKKKEKGNKVKKTKKKSSPNKERSSYSHTTHSTKTSSENENSSEKEWTTLFSYRRSFTNTGPYHMYWVSHLGDEVKSRKTSFDENKRGTEAIRDHTIKGIDKKNPKESNPYVDINNNKYNKKGGRVHLIPKIAKGFIREPEPHEECRRLDDSINDFSIYNIGIFDKNTGKLVDRYENTGSDNTNKNHFSFSDPIEYNGNGNGVSVSNGNGKQRRNWVVDALTEAVFEVLSNEAEVNGDKEVKLQHICKKVSDSTGYENDEYFRKRVQMVLADNRDKGHIEHTGRGKYRLAILPYHS